LLGASGALYLGRNWETEEEERAHPDTPSGWGPSLFYNRAQARLRSQLGYYTEPAFPKLLPTVTDQQLPPYTLVISLEDMLVHSEWSREHGWRVAKRPGAEFFLLYLSQYYEICLFTSQPFAMADPIYRKLDPYHFITWPLYREATRYEDGEYVKVCGNRAHSMPRLHC
jgi:import inner membrane translocase subunit TIM50